MASLAADIQPGAIGPARTIPTKISAKQAAEARNPQRCGRVSTDEIRSTTSGSHIFDMGRKFACITTMVAAKTRARNKTIRNASRTEAPPDHPVSTDWLRLLK